MEGGQLPGQTRRPPTHGYRTPSHFNGGPGNCPAKPGWPTPKASTGGPTSMEGRAIARPNTIRADLDDAATETSMEGRAIARPNCVRPGRLRSLFRPFNGGPGNCPAKPRRRVCRAPCRAPFNGGPGNCPAKPTRCGLGSGAFTDLQWRAGQLPGQTMPAADRHYGRLISLQWRAGQLPGQTRSGGRPQRAHAAPSMEGRAIARPN